MAEDALQRLCTCRSTPGLVRFQREVSTVALESHCDMGQGFRSTGRRVGPERFSIRFTAPDPINGLKACRNSRNQEERRQHSAQDQPEPCRSCRLFAVFIRLADGLAAEPMCVGCRGEHSGAQRACYV